MPPLPPRVAPRVVHAVLAYGDQPHTATSLAPLAQTARETVGDVVAALKPGGFLIRDKGPEGPLRFGPGLLTLAFAVGSENVRGALIDANGAMHHPRRAPERQDQLQAAPEIVLGRIRDVAADVLSAAIRDKRCTVDGHIRLLEATVAWPTPIDRLGYAHGEMLRSRRWRRAPLTEQTAGALGACFRGRVDAINDANAVALAVAFEDARQHAPVPDRTLRMHSETILALRVGGGIGAGTVRLPGEQVGRSAFIGSRLIVGSDGLAGEIGHLPVTDGDLEAIHARRVGELSKISPKWPCSCGETGHLESVASAKGLFRRLEASGYSVSPDEGAGPQIDALLGRPDPELKAALRDAGRLIGRALASPMLMLNPTSVTLQGYLALAAVENGIRAEQHSWTVASASGPELRSLQGEANDYAALRGAALAVLRRRFYRQIDTGAGSPAWWSKLTFAVGGDDVEGMLAGLDGAGRS